jgi:hypothetical protein
MKKLLVLVMVATLAIVGAANAQTFVNNDKDGTQVGSEVVNPVASTALTPPATAEWAVISIRTAGVHMTFDGSAATTSSLYMPTGLYRTAFVARATPTTLLANIRMINSTDGAATVYVAYMRRP